MRNPILHQSLRSFAAEASTSLTEALAAGEEIPFELVETGAGQGLPLHCWRPLTREFLAARVPELRTLPSYATAMRAIEHHAGLEGYLLDRGLPRVPARLRERADAAAFLLLERLMDGRTDLAFDARRFEHVYAELERSLQEGRTETVVLTWLSGFALEGGTEELLLGDGLALLRPELVPDAPLEALRGEAEPPDLLVLLRVEEDPDSAPALTQARARFRRLLSALRLYERGAFALGPVAWVRRRDGAWRTVALGATGRRGAPVTLPAGQEDEFRAFCNLVARRTPAQGEVAWALRRFEMGCERLAPLEALSDHLLALRALLEPEGPESGRLAARLATICALPEERAAMTERLAGAAMLERAMITGARVGEGEARRLPEELAEHLRAILRDVVCGHLDPDLVSLADEILAEAAGPRDAPFAAPAIDYAEPPPEVAAEYAEPLADLPDLPPAADEFELEPFDYPYAEFEVDAEDEAETAEFAASERSFRELSTETAFREAGDPDGVIGWP